MLRSVVPVTIALAIVFSASPGFAHSGGQAVAIFVDIPPVIDGEDDWPKAVWEEAQAHDMHMKPEDVPDWFIFPETSPNRISRGHIDDNNDLSVEFAFMFDDEWLYYIAKIIDDNVPDNLQSGEAENKTPQTAPHTSLWVLEFDYEHDAPIKPKGNDDRELARLADCRYQPGDHVYQLKPWTGVGQTQPACFESRGVYGDENYFNSHCTANVAAKRTADGFAIEGRLNFRAMFELAAKPNLPVPTDGSIWGFDSSTADHEVAVSGGNTAGREGAISWASSFENDNTTCILGDLRFVGAPDVNPTIVFEPAELVIPQESFGVVTIQIQQIANLAGFELELSFNPAVITVIDVTEGDFLKQSGGETFSPDPEMDNINGTVSMTVGRITPGGANGAGSLAQIRFQAKTTGQSPLTLTTVKLADTLADEIIATFSSASITVTALPPWDVNQDGEIDIFDIVIVGQHFGQNPPQDQRADVNRDGQVNVWDLVLLGSHLGESMHPAAPAFSPSAALFLPSIEKLTAMQQARAALEALPEKSSGAEIALAVLRSWLAQNESHVTTTQLLPNYPNPFNPETWIPYQLAVDTEVYITIYDARGKRVRRFNRGHQKAGAYVNRQRSAYWNGRSEIGELVSSGLYFYHLRAGDFTAIERMVILK